MRLAAFFCALLGVASIVSGLGVAGCDAAVVSFVGVGLLWMTLLAFGWKPPEDIN